MHHQSIRRLFKVPSHTLNAISWQVGTAKLVYFILKALNKLYQNLLLLSNPSIKSMRTIKMGRKSAIVFILWNSISSLFKYNLIDWFVININFPDETNKYSIYVSHIILTLVNKPYIKQLIKMKTTKKLLKWSYFFEN